MKLEFLFLDPPLFDNARRQNQTAQLSRAAKVQGNGHVALMDNISRSAIKDDMLDVVIEQAGHREEICKSTTGSNHLIDGMMML